ncbi:MAG: ABC transporter permease [Chthoniobacterales bacterium]|jgi:phospholipid/cholesterol/gamma-HCH transport system permease protein
MSGDASSQSATLRVEREGGGLLLYLQGRLDDTSVGLCWKRALAEVRQPPGPVLVDCAGVDYCGSAGLALLVALEKEAITRGETLQVRRLAPRFQALYDAVDRAKLEKPMTAEHNREGWVEDLGRAAAGKVLEWRSQTEFVGEVGSGAVALAVHPRKLRLREWWLIVEKSGTNGLPIVALISFLTGMIIAFQASIPMRQFGVDIFVVNLVALAMVRELGPIMTAIIFAGRSGAAFAAEIGTMKVNEEVAALTTMGLSPVRFLAVPRVLAGLAVTPVLTVYSMVVGVAGGVAVMLLRGFPLAALLNQLENSVRMQDVMAGFIKSFVFGAVVAGVGCLRGLQTGAGASAVGDATTRSVVTGIFCVVVIDAIFAVIYYRLNF